MKRRLVLAAATFAAAVATPLVLSAPASAGEKYPVPYTFTPTALIAGANVDADPPGANDWSCQPSKRHKEPVILVHGTGGNRNDNWQTFAPLLANEGYCVFALTYGVAPGAPPVLDQVGGMDKIENSAAQLAAFVAKVRKSTMPGRSTWWATPRARSCRSTT